MCFYDLLDWMMLWDLRENLLKVFSFFYYWCNMEGEVLPSRCTVIINLNLTWEYNQSILWDITCIYLKNMNPICLFPGSWNQWAWWKQKMEFLFTSSVCRLILQGILLVISNSNSRDNARRHFQHQYLRSISAVIIIPNNENKRSFCSFPEQFVHICISKRKNYEMQ